jgi:hypothetical protein
MNETLKYKCTRGFDIYLCKKNHPYTGYQSYFEIDTNTYELPELLADKSSKKLDELYGEIRHTYQDIVLYSNDQYISQEYEKFVSEYFDIKNYDNNYDVTRIDLVYWFEKL